MKRAIGLSNLDRRLRLRRGTVQACLRAIEAGGEFPVPPGAVGVAFVDPVACGRLHAEFFGDPAPTDVMTFPGDPADGHAGDIAVCPEVAAEACGGGSLPFAEELTLYLVHAWLHLAGLDDRDPAGRRAMRRAEARLMARLRAADAVLDCRWNG